MPVASAFCSVLCNMRDNDVLYAAEILQNYYNMAWNAHNENKNKALQKRDKLFK